MATSGPREGRSKLMTGVQVGAFVLLFLATFAALFIAQKVKSEPALVQIKRWPSPHFSPLNPNPRRRVSRFSFWLKQTDYVTVSIVDAKGNEIRRLGSHVFVHRYRPRHFAWNAMTNEGKLAPNGIYYIRVDLLHQQRSITL